jgi:hypothetical protein
MFPRITPAKENEQGQYPKEPSIITHVAKQASETYGMTKGPIDTGMLSEESKSGSTIRTVIPKVIPKTLILTFRNVLRWQIKDRKLNWGQLKIASLSGFITFSSFPRKELLAHQIYLCKLSLSLSQL